PSVNPGLVLRDPCAEALEDREPGPCVGVSASSEEAWNPGSESRTGPLDLRVSPDFRAAVSLGLLTFPRNPLLGKRPNQSVCVEFSRTRWASLWISVGGRNSRRRISALCCPQQKGAAVRQPLDRRPPHARGADGGGSSAIADEGADVVRQLLQVV